MISDRRLPNDSKIPATNWITAAMSPTGELPHKGTYGFHEDLVWPCAVLRNGEFDHHDGHL